MNAFKVDRGPPGSGLLGFHSFEAETRDLGGYDFVEFGRTRALNVSPEERLERQLHAMIDALQ